MVSAEHLTYRDYLRRLPEVTYMCSCKLVPMDVTALLQLDLSIAFPLIDLLLGGEGKGTLEPREVTEIEEQILESVVQIFCREMGVAWQALGLEFHFDRRQQPANALRLMPPDDKTLALSFSINMLETRGSADGCPRYGVDRASAKNVGGLGVSQTSRTGRIERASQGAHPALSLPDRVGCAWNRDTGGGIGEHQTSDLVVLRHAVNSPATLLVGEQPMFQAAVMRHERKRVARLIGTYPKTRIGEGGVMSAAATPALAPELGKVHGPRAWPQHGNRFLRDLRGVRASTFPCTGGSGGRYLDGGHLF